MTSNDFSLVNAVAMLNIACQHFDWRTVAAVIDEARENGATVSAKNMNDGVHLYIKAGRTIAADTVSGLDAKSARAVLESLQYAGAEVQS